MGFDPVTIGIGATVASGIIGGAGSLMAGDASAAASGYKAQMSYYNAMIAARKAEMAMQAGEIAAANQGLVTRAQIGSQKAAQAAGGVDVNTGSAPLVRAGTQQFGQVDVLNKKADAAEKAYGYQLESWSDAQNAKIRQAEGESAQKAGVIGGISSLLSSVSSIAGKYASWPKSGAMAGESQS